MKLHCIMAHPPHWLVLSAVGPDNVTQTLGDVLAMIESSGCHLYGASQHVFGKSFAAQWFLRGSWNAVAKLEAMIPTIQQKFELIIQLKRTHERDIPPRTLSYVIQIQTLEKKGILSELCSFFTQEGITVIETQLSVRHDPRTQAALLNLSMIIDLPEQIQVAALREHFMIYCEERNLDAVLEPER
jgi:glycine cleavage system transcriptional repressor